MVSEKSVCEKCDFNVVTNKTESPEWTEKEQDDE
jgi:hypothetical protein|tara:strand:+ start:189 stop:290 length:102 start_codon:yes stop_codon:yes gene_type:complete